MFPGSEFRVIFTDPGQHILFREDDVLGKIDFHPRKAGHVFEPETLRRGQQHVSQGLLVRCIVHALLIEAPAFLGDGGGAFRAETEKAHGFTDGFEFQRRVELLAEFDHHTVSDGDFHRFLPVHEIPVQQVTILNVGLHQGLQDSRMKEDVGIHHRHRIARFQGLGGGEQAEDAALLVAGIEMERHVRARGQAADVIDDPVGLVSDHEVHPGKPQLAQDFHVTGQQATPAKLHQALGVPFGIVIGQPAPVAGGKDDCVHRTDPDEWVYYRLTAMPKDHDNTLEALVIGAGFAGICMGKRLLDAGIRNFRIVDKAEKVGGTWYWNSYPGAACDVMSHFYCFSFEPNPDWSRKYSPWNEIQAYAERCVDAYGLRPFIQLGRGVDVSRFDDDCGLWNVKLTDGSEVGARHVIDGSGGLHVPLIPEIAGADSFEGETWHSSLWRHDVDLSGKKVAVIGSAASAVQIVPEIAQSAERVHLFQRTANYVIPRHDRDYTAFEKWCFRYLPLVNRLYRLFLYLRYDWLVYPIVKTPARNIQRRWALGQFRKLLRKAIPEAAVRDKLTPDYPIGCKRILISDNFYESLTRDDVSLVTATIQQITPRGVMTVDGVEHEADVLVYATGFDTQGHHTDNRVIGPKGLKLSDRWSDAPIAYEGCMVAGFPNYHFVTGPNTGVGSTSVIFMIEQSANLIMKCIGAAGKDGLIAPKEAAMQAYDAEIQAALAGTVWATSCSSWYKRDDGRITILYPYNAQTYRRRHRDIRLEDYEVLASSM